MIGRVFVSRIYTCTHRKFNWNPTYIPVGCSWIPVGLLEFRNPTGRKLPANWDWMGLTSVWREPNGMSWSWITLEFSLNCSVVILKIRKTKKKQNNKKKKKKKNTLKFKCRLQWHDITIMVQVCWQVICYKFDYSCHSMKRLTNLRAVINLFTCHHKKKKKKKKKNTLNRLTMSICLNSYCAIYHLNFTIMDI